MLIIAHFQVELYGQQPPIEKLDNALSTLKCCTHLSLSTNNIDKIEKLSNLTALQVLSLGRNQIKKLEGLDTVADTLQELWISYNLLEKLVRLFVGVPSWQEQGTNYHNHYQHTGWD